MLVKHERRPFRFGVTLLAGLLGCLSLMGCKDEKTGAQAPTVPAVEVAVEIVTPQKVLYTTELAGRTSGFQIAEVRPQVSGIIQKRFFEEGADVKAGDVLYQIDPATYQANLDSAKANLARAEANVAPARLKMQRFKDLVNISAVSKQEFEDAEAAYKQALADVGVNKAAVENARIRLAYTKVTSPISGRSGRSLVTPGALVTENQSSPLTTVQQLDPVYVDVTQSSTEVLRLKRSLEDGTLQRADQDHAAVRLLLEDGSEYGLAPVRRRERGREHRHGDPAGHLPEPQAGTASGHVRARHPERRRGRSGHFVAAARPFARRQGQPHHVCGQRRKQG